MFISVLLFSLAKLQTEIKLQQGGVFIHSVMYSSAQNDDAKLALRGQTSADRKCFLLREPSLFLRTSFVVLC